MIIDSHLHFGKIAKFNMSETQLLNSLKRYNIDFGLVSNIEGCEFDSNLKPIPKREEYTQLKVNKKTLNLVRRYPDKLRGLFWIKPHNEPFTEEVKDFILDNREWFVGLKIHPYHSNLKMTDERYIPYLEFANKYKLPVAVHTAKDEISSPKNVYQIADQYPDINFIMVHMGLGTDNVEAIEYIKKLGNLYGDTTWVNINKVSHAINHCGSHKILFGTDNPIDGVDTYQKYSPFLKEGLNLFAEEDYSNLMYKNALRILKLNGLGFGLTK